MAKLQGRIASVDRQLGSNGHGVDFCGDVALAEDCVTQLKTIRSLSVKRFETCRVFPCGPLVFRAIVLALTGRVRHNAGTPSERLPLPVF